jgi:hypothetical protein
VKDVNGFAVAYVYYEEEPGRRAAADFMTRDEARRIAVNIAKLPDCSSDWVDSGPVTESPKRERAVRLGLQ